MWHPLTRVAESRRVDPEKFIRFAKEKPKQYGLIHEDSTDPMVSTWHVDQLVKDFKAGLWEQKALPLETVTSTKAETAQE